MSAWRELAGRTLTTYQWEYQGFLMESFGGTVFASSLSIDGHVMTYHFERAWFAGIPLPRWLSPSASGSVRAGESGWFVDTQSCADLARRFHTTKVGLSSNE